MMHRIVGLIVASMLLGGCSTPGDFTSFYLPRGDLALASTQVEDAPSIQPDFEQAYYSAEDPQRVNVLLVAGPEESPTQIVHIQMFWRPRAGKTPFDPTATNATIRYVILDGDQAAIFGGGGLLRPHDLPGDDKWTATMLNATLRLMDQTQGFDAGLGTRALAEGSFTVKRDEQRMVELLRKVNAIVEDRLGYPRIVEAQ